MKNLSKEELLSRLEAINRSNAIIYFDLTGIITGVNDIFLEAMGYGKGNHQEIIGKHHSISNIYKNQYYVFSNYSNPTKFHFLLGIEFQW